MLYDIIIQTKMSNGDIEDIKDIEDIENDECIECIGIMFIVVISMIAISYVLHKILQYFTEKDITCGEIMFEFVVFFAMMTVLINKGSNSFIGNIVFCFALFAEMSILIKSVFEMHHNTIKIPILFIRSVLTMIIIWTLTNKTNSSSHVTINTDYQKFVSIVNNQTSSYNYFYSVMNRSIEISDSLNSEALNNFGMMYHNNNDIQTSIHLLKHSADMFNVKALYNLGTHYSHCDEDSIGFYSYAIYNTNDPSERIDVDPQMYSFNERKAIDYYTQAANLGNTYAMNILGIYYNYKKDYEQMMHWYNKASFNGNDGSQLNVKNDNYTFIVQNYEPMIAHYRANPSEYFKLASYYRMVENNYEAAEKYYSQAIDGFVNQYKDDQVAIIPMEDMINSIKLLGDYYATKYNQTMAQKYYSISSLFDNKLIDDEEKIKIYKQWFGVKENQPIYVHRYSSGMTFDSDAIIIA